MNLKGVLTKRCPKCQKGKLFSAWFSMNERCSTCGMHFDREEGYYTGAMFINWFFAVFLITPVWVALLFLEVNFFVNLLITLVLLIFCLPLFFQYSRALWLYIDYTYFHQE